MRSQLLVSLLFCLVARQPARADEEYFKKSVFKALKEKAGQFSSEYSVRFLENHTVLNRDRFSFKLNVHDLTAESNLLGRRRLLLVNQSEVHVINEETKVCLSNPLNKTMFTNQMSKIVSPEVFDPDNQVFFGANSLLEVLNENLKKNKDSVKCEDEKDAKKKNPKKCTITFKEAKVEYYLVDKPAYTMFPEKIVTYAKQGKEWKVQAEIIYARFTPSFEAKPIVNGSLPAGFGCKRLNPEDSPRIQPFFGKKFETEFEVHANILQKRGKPKSEEVIMKTIQIKTNINLEKGMAVAHIVDKETSMNITSVLDTKNRTVYTINTAANMCYKTQVPADAIGPTNMSKLEIMEQFKKGTENFTFLGEYLVDQVLCNAFEYRTPKDMLSGGSSMRYERLQYAADFVTVTLYYPKDAKHWSKNDAVSIPKRVEVRLFDSLANKEFATGRLDVKSFNTNPKDPEKIDTSKCDNMNGAMG